MSVSHILKQLFRYRPPTHLNNYGLTFPLLVLVLGLGIATISQVWLGYRATKEWRASANMVVDRRVEEVTSLLIIALMRDMRGAYESLGQVQREDLQVDRPQDISDVIARTLARYPYVDGFFLWKGKPADKDSATFFSRTDRPPAWAKTAIGDNPFPVTVIPASSAALTFVSLARKSAIRQGEFAFFDTNIDGSSHQVVARFFYNANSKNQVSEVFGFDVNLAWVTTHYFTEFMHQINHLMGSDGAALSMSILDSNGKVVSRSNPPNSGSSGQTKKFPLAFFDLSDVPMSALDNMAVHQWSAEVSAANDPLLRTTDVGTRRVRILIVFAALISLTALLLVFRFLRMNFELFAMKSDFVAMVSHELKTPLASISLVGQALTSGRFKPTQIGSYGELLSKESTRLTRLVENLLNLSRVTHSEPHYSRTIVDVNEILNEAQNRLQTQVNEKLARVIKDCGDHLPLINGDREALTQVFVNVIENAIKYSDEEPEIKISATTGSNRVALVISDKGHGIPAEDSPHVFESFFRGKNAGLNGTGLGLAIARKVIQDHGGRISIESVPTQGTTVRIELPIGNEGVV